MKPRADDVLVCLDCEDTGRVTCWCCGGFGCDACENGERACACGFVPPVYPSLPDEGAHDVQFGVALLLGLHPDQQFALAFMVAVAAAVLAVRLGRPSLYDCWVAALTREET